MELASQEAKPVEEAKPKKEAISFKEKIFRLREVIEIVRGKEDAKLRPNIILNPENPKTTSNLTELQVDFVTNSYFIADYFPEFLPLKQYAGHYLEVNESKEGWAVQKIIEHEQALGEKRMMQLGLRPPQQQEGLKEKIKGASTKE